MVTAPTLDTYIKKLLLISCAVAAALSPLLTHANGTTGFIDRNIWHTPETYHAGDSVRIYTALINTTGEDVTGKVTFFVNDEKIGVREFSMRENDPVSYAWYDWTAEEGSHAFRAAISNTTTDAEQEVTTLSSTETIIARTEKKPEPETSAEEGAASSTDSNASSSKDSVADYTTGAGEFIDNLAAGARNSLEKARENLDKKIAEHESPTSDSDITINSLPQVLGTSTTASSAKDAVEEANKKKSSITLTVMKVARGMLSGVIGILSHPAGVAFTILAILFIAIKLIQFIWRKVTFSE